MFRVFGRALALMLATAVGLSAVATTAVTFSDTKLKNGLRVIISEDHTAPPSPWSCLQRRLARRAAGPHRVRPSVRAHDVQGLGERRARRALLPHLQQRRQHERHDERGSHALLRGAAGQSARPGAVPRSRSHAVAGDQQGRISTTSATLSRKSAGSASTTSRTASAVEEIDELTYDNFAYKHSVIGSMADLNAASVEDVAAFFKTYYAPNNAILSIVGDVDAQKTLAQGEEYFGACLAACAHRRSDVGAAAERERRSTIRRSAGAAGARRRRLVAFRRAFRRLRRTRRPDRRAGRRSERAALSKYWFARSRLPPRPGSSSTRVEARPVPDVRDGRTRQEPRRRRGRALRRDRKGEDDAGRRLGNREGPQQRAAQCRQRRVELVTTSHRAGTGALFYNDPNRINTSTERVQKITAADVQRVAAKYLTKENRSVIITTPKPAAPRGGQQ